MSCRNCEGEVYTLHAKSGDLNHVSSDTGEDIIVGDYLDEDKVPNIGDGNYINMDWCINCGQIQGCWPIDDK